MSTISCWCHNRPMETSLELPNEKSRWRWQAFNLVYLLFYFLAWMWRPPTLVDVLAAGAAIAVFLPIFLTGFERHEPRFVWHAVALEALAYAVHPFNGINGVFHVYACVQAAYQRPSRRSIWVLAGLSASYAVFALLIEADMWSGMFTVFLGVITGMSCMAAAAGLERGRHMRRAWVLEQQRAALAERERIAHDLHDLLGHTLTVVALKSEVAHKLIDRDPARARTETAEVAEAARAALADIRAAVYDMTATTVEQEIQRAREALRAANVELTVDPVPALDPAVSKTLGLSIREAVTNIVRHARASAASIRFRFDGETLEVVVSDNGQGRGDTPAEGAGLTGLRKRIRAIGGQARIRDGDGTAVHISLPLDGHEAGA